MATKWTPDQQNAIYDNRGTLLVSAAAGSGKTAVLVERVIQKLIDSKNPTDADRLLIVTFSNAAAAEMRGRIFKKLSELSALDEYRSRLSRQLLLLDNANISTVHSFCIRILRQNFNALGISPTFRVADENEITVLKGIAINKTVQSYYAENDPCFLQLVELLSTFRDDGNLVSTVLKLYESVRAYPFYRDWLKAKLHQYEQAKNDPLNSLWADVIFDYSTDALLQAQEALSDALEKIRDYDVLREKYVPAFENDLKAAKKALECAKTRDLDGLYSVISKHSFERLTAVRNCEDKALQKYAQAQRSFAKSVFEDLFKRVCTDTDTFKEDIVSLLPKIQKLFDLTLDFSDRLDEMKKDRNILDFADIEQFTLQLLIDKTENGYVRSEIAKQLSENFDEILIDEYQDTNAAQDMIFSALSNNGENLFMVGDVKQSIYQFRQAMPELFIRKQNTFAPYDGEHYPALIHLSKNFRSRGEVTSAINYFFSLLMSTGFGQVSYDENEALVCGATYPEGEGYSTDVDIVSLKESDTTLAGAQARHIASRITELMMTLKVTDRQTGELRPPRFSDFCILMRSPKNTASEYLNALTQAGIPAYYNNAEGCLNTPEIATLLSLLRIINNPSFDIDLITVLYSFLYNFSSDDLAKVRLVDRKASLYKNVLVLANDQDSDIREKCKNFVEDIADFRRNASQMRVHELIEYIFQKTDYPSMIAARYDDEIRVANLNLFKEYAISFEVRPTATLDSFLRYIDRLIESGGNFPGAGLTSENANVVRIMSIHRSKGLEFPVCFVTDLAKGFNKQDINARAVLHSNLGFACVRRDEALHAQYNTIPLTATRLAMEDTQLSEELRMLYVALTRAKEKLILVIPASDPDKIVDKLTQKNPRAMTTPYVLKRSSSFSQWILLALLKHPSSRALEGSEELPLADVPYEADINLQVYDVPPIDDMAVQVADVAVQQHDAQIEKYIKESYSYSYPYEGSTELFAKASVSDLSKKEHVGALREPQFLKGDTLDAAKKGTAIHKFMQYCDYARAKSDSAAEIQRLCERGQLSALQAKNIDPSDIDAFFCSPVAERIFASPQVRRELKFTLLLSATEVDTRANEDDKIIVQGIADCVYRDGDTVVVLDFKSDRVKDAQTLIDRYSGQLELYKKAISEMFGTDKVRRLIYSFALKETIELD